MGKPGSMNPAYGFAGTKNRGVDWFSMRVVLGATGAITVATTDTVAQCKLSIVKTAAKTGRYTITLPDKYRRFCGGFVTAIGVTDAQYGATTTGLDYFWRNNNIDGGTNKGTIDLQFTQTNYTDAEVPDNTVLLILLAAARGL